MSETTSPPSPIDLTALRHPREPSRMALAMCGYALVAAVAAIVLTAVGNAVTVAVFAVAFALVLVVLWFSLGWFRLAALADGVRVSSGTLPELRDVIDQVQRLVDYPYQVDVFVFAELKPPLIASQVFGRRVIKLSGDVVGDLSTELGRRQLGFLLGTAFGAFKARTTTLIPLLGTLEGTALSTFVLPFSFPWRRATVLTGDRIAAVACGDLMVSLRSVAKVLVGSELAPALRPGGIIPQALRVRRSILLRLAELFRSSPHTTNRYLELLAFAEQNDAAGFAAYRSQLAEPETLDLALARTRRLPPSRATIPLGIAVASLVLLGGVAAATQIRETPTGAVIAAMADAFIGADSATEPTFEPPAEPDPTHQPISEPAGPPTTPLLERVPADLRVSCSADPPELDREVAYVRCMPTVSVSVRFHEFADLTSAVEYWNAQTGSVPNECAPRWTDFAGTPRGSLSCWSTTLAQSVTWTYDGFLVVGTISSLGGSLTETMDLWSQWAAIE